MSRHRLARPQEPGSLPQKTPPGPISSDYRPGIITPERLHVWALTRLPYYIEAYNEAVRYQRWYRRAARWVWNSWPVMQLRIGIKLVTLNVADWYRDLFGVDPEPEPENLPAHVGGDPVNSGVSAPANPESQDVRPPAGAPSVQVGP